jgi:hypothetical protein
MTAAKAAPWLIVKVPTATAIASSKLLLAAVNESEAPCRRWRRSVAHPETDREHDDEIDEERDRDAHASSGLARIWPPRIANMTTIVKSRKTSVSGLIFGSTFSLNQGSPFGRDRAVAGDQAEDERMPR